MSKDTKAIEEAFTTIYFNLSKIGSDDYNTKDRNQARSVVKSKLSIIVSSLGLSMGRKKYSEAFGELEQKIRDGIKREDVESIRNDFKEYESKALEMLID